MQSKQRVDSHLKRIGRPLRQDTYLSILANITDGDDGDDYVNDYGDDDGNADYDGKADDDDNYDDHDDHDYVNE